MDWLFAVHGLLCPLRQRGAHKNELSKKKCTNRQTGAHKTFSPEKKWSLARIRYYYYSALPLFAKNRTCYECCIPKYLVDDSTIIRVSATYHSIVIVFGQMFPFQKQTISKRIYLSIFFGSYDEPTPASPPPPPPCGVCTYVRT